MKIYYLVQTLNYTIENISTIKKIGNKYNLNLRINTKKNVIKDLNNPIINSYIGINMIADKEVDLVELKNLIFNCTKELETIPNTYVVGIVINYGYYTINSLIKLLNNEKTSVNILNLLYYNYFNFININVNVLLNNYYKYYKINNIKTKSILLY